jgi:hypothetical protein
MYHPIGSEGQVLLAPEVLRIKVLEIEAKQTLADAPLFLSLSWIGAEGREKLYEAKTTTKSR